MSKLIMMRHGESKWNKLNLFTGWVDIPLSEKGIEEALEGRTFDSRSSHRSNLHHDINSRTNDSDARYESSTDPAKCLSSCILARASWKSGVKFSAKRHKRPPFLTIRCWELNERMYGELQGLNKTETAEKFGEDQVKLWREAMMWPLQKERV